MNRLEIFTQLIDSLIELSRNYYPSDNKPRKYGTEDQLYVVEVHYLNIIGNQEKTTITELTELTDKTKGAISRTVNKLYEKGLISKTKSENNYRELILELTDKGHLVYNFHNEYDNHLYTTYLNQLSEYSNEDFEKMYHLIDKLSHLHTDFAISLNEDNN